MARRNRKKKTNKQQVISGNDSKRITPQEILEESGSYRTARKLLLGSVVACALCFLGAILIRSVLPDLEPIALVLNILSYLLLGCALALWFIRIRRLSKESERIAEEYNATIPQPDCAIDQAGTDSTATQSQTLLKKYKKYRNIWRVLVILGAVAIFLAFFSQEWFREGSIAPIIILGSAYIPIGGAIHVHNKYIKPIRKEWQGNPPKK